jgi:hypothetical protein
MGGWAWIFALFFAYTQSTLTPVSRPCHLARCFDRLTLGRLAPRGTLALVRWLAMAVHSSVHCHFRGCDIELEEQRLGLLDKLRYCRYRRYRLHLLRPYPRLHARLA